MGASFDNVRVGLIFASEKLIGAVLRSFSQPALLARGGGNIKDLTVCLDAARPPPRYALKNNMISANSKI